MIHYNDFSMQRIWSSGYDSLNTCSKIFVLIIFIFFRNPHISTIDLWPPTGYPQVHWHLNRFGKCQLCSVVAIASWSGSFGPEKSRVKSWTSSIFHKRCKITSYYSAVCVCLCCVCVRLWVFVFLCVWRWRWCSGSKSYRLNNQKMPSAVSLCRTRTTCPAGRLIPWFLQHSRMPAYTKYIHLDLYVRIFDTYMQATVEQNTNLLLLSPGKMQLD